MARWAAFERLFGPLTIHERLDHAAALVSFYVASGYSKDRLEYAQFVPQWTHKEESDDSIVRKLNALGEIWRDR